VTVRWGILGCGDVCEVKSGPAFQKARGSELVAVMRRDRAKAEDFARRHGVPAFYDDADALLADPRVDAVYVAAPPGNHQELALKVAAAGKPCYVEKPMARSHAECTRMVQAFELLNQPLFVAYYRRALDRFVKAKELIDAGRLGEIHSIEVRYASDGQSRLDPARLPWRVQAEHAGGGLFLDLASHTLDVLDFWFGPLQGVTGEADQVAGLCDVEDRVTLRFSTLLGARGSAEWNFCASTPEDTIVVAGSQATLRMSTFGEQPVELQTGSEGESFRLPNPPHIQQPFIQSMVDTLLEQGSCPSSGVSAARTSDVMDRALAGYYGTREGEFWREPQRWPGRRAAR
jgi:predicted dehydrogenase